MRELWIAICDDLEEERLALARMIHRWAQRRELSVQLRSFASGEDLLGACRQPDRYQILFLDIFMPGLSGIDTARRLRAAGCNMAIIFATTSLDHGIESFELRASDYLVKPFQPEDVAQALDWCLEHLPEPLRAVSVYAEGEWQELPLASIRYIEVLNHHCHIHTSRQTVVTRRGLDELETAIDSRDFLRSHRSFLVNMNHVAGIEGGSFRMSDGVRVPISAANQAKIRNTFIDWTYQKAWEQP